MSIKTETITKKTIICDRCGDPITGTAAVIHAYAVLCDGSLEDNNPRQTDRHYHHSGIVGGKQCWGRPEDYGSTARFGGY